MKTKGAKLFLCSKKIIKGPLLCLSYLGKTIGKKVKFSIMSPTSKLLLQSMIFLSQLVSCHTPHVTNILLSMVSKRCLKLILTT